ncbi:MAG: TerC/Alx family metal homeostasis membrane protein [Phycisphaeraceae bacterium]|nr:TerC/Alx family metal homeostasis membrane protein [Phycisphaeraceae bacterium]
MLFTLFILGMLALDLGLFQRKPHTIGMKEGLIWFGVWTGLAMLFNLGVILFHDRGLAAGMEFFTGFLVEKSLSIDNIFVFILIFGYFRVPQAYHHKVLFWGIVGAIVLRVTFILGGMALMRQFHWMIYVFGLFLVATGLAMLRKKDSGYDPGRNWVVRGFRRVFPVTDRYDSNRFFTRLDGRLAATPLFIVLLAVESSDIIFAVDSIPAIFAITPDPFIVFTSNIFAMLGLRALYFSVAGFMRMFHFLHFGFASIILILGGKMLLSDVYKVPVGVSLVLIVVILLLCVIVSLLRPRRADLKPLFERAEQLGLIPFRRLLLIENILDVGDLRVQHAMRIREHVHAIRLDLPWEENLAMIRERRLSRYPLLGDAARPMGIIHIKNLFLTGSWQSMTSEQLRRIARPCGEVREDMLLENALGYFQGRYEQMAMVVDSGGQWTGIITFEDVLEELVGRIGDEFDLDRGSLALALADALAPGRIVFDLQAETMSQAIENLVAAIPSGDLPAERGKVVEAVLQRERSMPTYLGKGLAIPHARLEGLTRPVLAFARSSQGIALTTTNERAELIFLLLTPAGMARIQPQLLADIVRLFDSEYVAERLREARTPEEVIEAIRAGQLAGD